MSKNNFQERLRKMEDTKQRFSIRKFSIGAASVLIGLTIFGMGNETVHAAEQPAQNQNGEVQTSAVNKESDASEAKQESVTSEATEKKQEVSVDQKASTAQLENKAPVSAVKEESQGQEVGTQQDGDENQNQTKIQNKQGKEQLEQQVASGANEPEQDDPAQKNGSANATAFKNEIMFTMLRDSKVQVAAPQHSNSDTVTVTDANGLIDAIQNGTATTINIGKNIDLGEKTSSNYTNTNISNKRNIIIQSADGKHYTVDFNGYGFNMYSNDYGVTFKDLDLYGRSYFGIVRSAGSYTFDNVNYTGSQLIYTDSGYNTTVNFDGNVTAHSVGSYTSPLNNKSQSSQGGNNQQVIQFAAGTNTINFNSGSTVTLTTTNSNVLEVDGGKTTINVKNGAQVSLNPHTQNGPEQINGMNMDGIARGIASKGDTTLNIDQGGNLDINLTKNTEDKHLSSALYLNSGATINVNGNLNINSDGTPYYRYQGWDDPVYINGNAAINVNGGSFKVNATNMGDYKGSVVTSNGNSTIAISHHGTFDVTGDGTQATGVSLGNGSTFTSTQPKLFNISMPNGATAIKNGKVQFKGVKTSADGQPVGEIDITYASDGTPTVTKVTSYDEATTTATRTAVNNAKNKINLVAAGEEVNLSNVSFVKNADGTYTMSGNANTADNKGAYVYISVNGQVHQVAPTDSQTLWTAEATGDPTSSQVPYTAETGADGKFSVNLGKLNDSDQVSVYGAKDFVTSDTDTKTVSDWMTSSYRDQLQKLVDEAPNVEAGSNFTNATDNLKTTYTNAISAGSTLLQDSSATSEQLEAAANAITAAKTALNGDLNKVKQDLQAAVDAASDFENTSATYYNADTTKQKAYTNAVAAGSTALNDSNATVDSLTAALNKINDAKKALDGQPTNKQALQDAVNNSKDVKDSNNYTNADQNEKTAYDNAVTAAQSVLDNENATQAQVTQALQDLNTANGKLNGDAKTEAANRAALEEAVKEAPTVEKTSSKYYNGTEKAQNDYKNAVSEGQKVLDNPSATAAQIKTALDNINVAKDALDGDSTDKTTLQNGVDNAVDLDKSNADAQAKKAYTNALDKAKQVLADPNATQQAVNEANTALTNAKTALDNSSALQNAKDALQQAVDAKSTTEKTSVYYNADSAKQQAYNTAISAGTDALNAQNPTVESLTTALNKINEAKAALNGKETDTSKLKAAVDNADTVKAGNDYKDASADVQKQYDDAVKAGQQLLDPTTAPSPLTQADIDRAAKAITDAQSALTTSATTNVKDAKKTATTDLTTAVDAAKKAIDQDTNLTEDERNAAKAQVDSDASVAKEAINKATTNDAVTSAATAGKVTIDKTVANAAVDNAAAGKNKAIDGSSLTDEEKNGLKTQVAQAVKTAKDAISAADTEQAVTTAQKNGVDAINGINVPSTSTQKDEAKGNINKAADAAKKEIDQDSNLTDEQKQAAKDQIDSDAKNAQKEIDDAKNDTDINKAVNDGKLAIDKTAANAAIDNAVAGKNKEIANSPLTTDEQNKLKDQVTEKANAAKDNINKATTPAEVITAKDNGVAAINGIKVSKTSLEKDKAKENLDKQVQDAKDAINKDNNLTDEQKQAAKDQIDTDAKNAQDAIDNAKTNDDVKKATDAGQLAIDKTVANAAIDNAAAGKLKDIKDPLTNEEKKTYTDLINEAANNAKQNVDNATTPKEVTKAQEDGVNAIDKINVPTTSPVKDAADKAIDEALAKKQAEINKSTTLTDEEKTNLDKQAQNAANTAKQNIANAKTDSDVATAKDNGVAAIDGIKVPTNSTAKDQAKSNITDAADMAKQAIDQDSNLTNDQKQAAKNQVDTDAKNAQDAIDNAKTDADVNNAVDNGKLAIDKTVADAAIDNVVAGKIKDVKAPLTTDEQKTLTDLIKETGENAKQNIANATTPADVTTAQNNGVKAINDINIPTNSSVKDNATAAIDKALQNKKNEINNATNITAQEKQDLIKQATDAANTAKDNINNATSDSAVITAQTNGEKAIADVTIPGLSDIKKESTDLINKTLDKKKDEINNASNLSNDEKQQLINDATKAATDAINNINNAKTNDEAKAAADTGVQNIENISIPSLDDAKKDANQAIDDALESKTNEINNASNLTDKEKQNLIAKANAAAKTAKDNINSATTNAAVKKAEENGVEAIKSINFTNLDDAKKAANNAIDNALTNKTNEINNASNLSQDEKQDLINKATDAANTAKDNIAKASTNDAVTNAQNKGIEAIANVTVPSLAETKQEAIEAIKQVQAAKDKQISAAKNLDADQQKALTDQVDKIAKDAIAKINDPATTTNDAVKTARDNAIDQITNLFIPTLDGAQKDANDAINAAKQAKTDEINNAANLTDQEKQNLIDKVNKAADEATNAIKNATTDNAVKDAETKGLNEINGVTIPTLAEKQQAANVAIDQAAKAKKAEIAKALQAGNIDQAKADSLNTEVDNDVTNAMKAVANATTNVAVIQAQTDGVNKINAIKVPSSTYNPDVTDNTSTGSGDTDSTLTKPAEEATLKLILTHNAYIYNKDYQIAYKDNKRVVLKKDTQIIALDNGKKYLIKGKEFYRIGDNQYVKVSNTISYYYLVHNSFLYNKHGKAIKRNGKRVLVRKGVRLEVNKVKVVRINGKKFYKVGKSTYIKFRNVKLIVSPNN